MREFNAAIVTRRPNLTRWIDTVFRPLIGVYRCYTQRLVPMMAAGLAFWFLLGLIPFLFITTAAAGYAFRNEPGALANLATTLAGLLPPGIGERVLGQVHTAVAGWQAFGVLGMISLLFVAMGLFEAIDWSINGSMGTRKKVGFLTGRLIFLAYVTGAVVFFSLAAVSDYLFHLVLAAPALHAIADYVYIPRRTVAIVAFAVFIFILYMTIPVRTPRAYRAGVISIAVAGVWAVLQKLGASITVHISQRHAIYGALAGGTVFLTWMYLLALIVLLGATILDVWARRRRPG